jgi:Zn-dependent M28 family amino/carboxypeptidase
MSFPRRAVACAAALIVCLVPARPRAQAAGLTHGPLAPAAPIAADEIMQTVRTLADPALEGRGAGTDGGRRAVAWVAGRFAAIGLQKLGDSYAYPFSFMPGQSSDASSAINATNLVGRCQGTEPDWPAIVVSAHVDHLGAKNGSTYPGADDDASGVGVLLAIAERCLNAPFRHTLIVVVFDAEERGLRGARAFVANPPVPLDRIALDFNLDMVARGDKGELYASGLYHWPAMKPLLAPVASRAPIKLLFGHDLPGSGHDDWTMQSDHGAFHQAGIPFVYFGVEDHPDYHEPTDTPDRIDAAFYARAANTILDALHALDARQGYR